MTFKYSISKNHYNGYTYKETTSVAELMIDLSTYCVSPVTMYEDKEITNVLDGKTWSSKNHRSIGTIKERGNLGMIDFEGSKNNLKNLLSKMSDKDLFFVAIPSQSNKSDKKNARYHILYLLTTPYAVNAEAMKVQAKAFFDYIGYVWDESDSGIDTRASFNAAGYFSPTIPLKDAKSRDNKKISDPYIDLDDVAKDALKSRHYGAYTPNKPHLLIGNEEYSNNFVRGRILKDDVTTKIIRTTKKGYVLSSDTHIMTGTVNRFVTFEMLVDKLGELKGDNPRISGLGCPICNPDHADLKPGYAFMQYDSEGIPYITCTGNGCRERPYFTMSEGNISVYRIDDAAGVSKYVMFEDESIIYTHDRDMTFKRDSSAVADELFNKGQYVRDDKGFYSRALTVHEYCVGAESIQINHDPFVDEGIDIHAKTFNISPAARFEPTAEDANDVISEAIKAFEDDALICGYPVSLVYLSYYMFHYKQIMAVLFLVNPDRGSGKSFWLLDLPTWYLGYNKVSGMGSAAIIAGWDDDKLGKRLVVYEDVENLNKRELGILRGEIKSDATAGTSKMLNIKGQGKKRSFGFNSAGTSNHYSQIPFDGSDDRRIYPSPYKKINKSGWLAAQLRVGSKSEIKNRTNAINFLYKIYTECEKSKDKDLHTALYYKVPMSSIRGVVEDSTSTDSNVAMNILKRAKNSRTATKELSNIIASDIPIREVKTLMQDIEFYEDHIRIPTSTLNDLWKMLPTGRDSIKSVSHRKILNIFNIEGEVKDIRFKNGKVKRGVIICK